MQTSIVYVWELIFCCVCTLFLQTMSAIFLSKVQWRKMKCDWDGDWGGGILKASVWGMWLEAMKAENVVENKSERLNTVSWVKGFMNEKVICLKGLVWGKGLLPDSLSHASSFYAAAAAAVADLGSALMVILKKNELWVYATRLWSPLCKEAYTIRG